MIIRVNTTKNYEIKIGNGIITNLPEGFIITDKNVYNFYGNLIRGNSFILKPGEKSKNLITYREIVEKLSESGEERIIAFGGGVIGDIAGFVASTYKRGIELIQVPTTLLAMVDSSIGGKNGINISNKKNYIGTIYQPNGVLIDPSFLETLPEHEFKNGLAEVIKYFAVFNKPNIKKLENISKFNDIEKIITECCQMKVNVVERDEFDKGYRHILNFGHTIGHAIELLYGLSHGEAISIGMIKELKAGIKLGIINRTKLDEIENLLISNKLPTELPYNSNLEKIISLIKSDKKGKFIFSFNEKNYNVLLDEKIIREVLT